MNTKTTENKKSNKEVKDLRELSANRVASIYLNLNVQAQENK